MSRYILSPGVVVQQVLSESVLLDTEKGEYFELNETGSRMLRAIEEHNDPEAALEAVFRDYEVSRETLARDYAQLVSAMLEKGLIQKRPEKG